MTKIKFIDVRKFINEFYVRRINDSRAYSLRLGQVFLNNFFPTVVDPDLFYCEIPGECERLIYLKYTDFGE